MYVEHDVKITLNHTIVSLKQIKKLYFYYNYCYTSTWMSDMSLGLVTEIFKHRSVNVKLKRLLTRFCNYFNCLKRGFWYHKVINRLRDWWTVTLVGTVCCPGASIVPFFRHDAPTAVTEAAVLSVQFVSTIRTNDVPTTHQWGTSPTEPKMGIWQWRQRHTLSQSDKNNFTKILN